MTEQTTLERIEAWEKQRAKYPEQKLSHDDITELERMPISVPRLLLAIEAADMLASPQLRADLQELEVYRRGAGEDVRKELADWKAKEKESGGVFEWAADGMDILNNHAPAIIASAALAERLKLAEGLLKRYRKESYYADNPELCNDINIFLGERK